MKAMTGIISCMKCSARFDTVEQSMGHSCMQLEAIDSPSVPGTVCATWLNIMGEISLRAGIDLALGSEGPYTEGTADKAEHAYRAAIAEAFADTGIVLAGDEFIRPVSKQVDWEDLASAIKSVNFWEIIERAIEDTACEGHESLSGAIGTTAYCDGSCR